MTPEDQARADQIRARADAATPGPWEIFRYRHGGGRIHLSGDDGRKRELIADMEPDPDDVATAYSEGDREFLFAARSDVPWLLDRLAAATERADKAEAAARADVLAEVAKKLTKAKAMTCRCGTLHGGDCEIRNRDVQMVRALGAGRG